MKSSSWKTSALVLLQTSQAAKVRWQKGICCVESTEGCEISVWNSDTNNFQQRRTGNKAIVYVPYEKKNSEVTPSHM
jgi:hypothetical protein